MTTLESVASSTVQSTSAGMPMMRSVCLKEAPCSTAPGSPPGQPACMVSHSSKRPGSVARAHASAGGLSTLIDLETDGISNPFLEAHRLADELFHDLVGACVDAADAG